MGFQNVVRVGLKGLGAAGVAGAGYFYIKRKISPEPTFDFEDKFKSFVVSEVSDVSADTKRIRLDVPKGRALGLETASCLLARVKVNTDEGLKTIVRPYTPITLGDVRGHFDLLVKAYPETEGKPTSGACSRAITSLKPGDKLDVKGPIMKFPWHSDPRRRVGMIAGGTGITPMFQIIQEAIWDPRDDSEISLIYANRSEEDILLREELEDLRRIAREKGKKFDVHYVVERAGPEWTGGRGYVSPAAIRSHLPPPGPDTLIFVCGPPPMYNAISGSKDFKTSPPQQGSLRGHLALLNYKPSMVFKF